MPDTDEDKNKNQEPSKEEKEEQEENEGSEEHYEDRVNDIITGVMVEPAKDDS